MLKKLVEYFQRYGIRHTAKKIICKLYVNYFEGVFRVNRRLGRRQRAYQENYSFPEKKRISILVPLYNTPEKFLKEMIDSVLKQTYGRWQLCLADGSDVNHSYVGEVCRSFAEKEPRILYKKLKENRGISENTNVCIEMAEGEYLALFDHDDLLHPSALFEVMAEITRSGADFVYTDEATFAGRETHLLSVHRKPDFYMENLRANNYICHFTVFKKALLDKSGVFRKEYDGSQDFDLILRLCENASNIRHIPKVLYFWRAHSGSVAQDISSKEYAIDAGLRAVKSHLQRQGIPASVEKIKDGMTIYRVRYDMDEKEIEKLCVLREGEEQRLDAVRRDASIQYVLLLKKGLECPKQEDIKRLLSHMVKQQTAAVTGKIIGKNGKIWTAGVEIREKSGKRRVRHLYRGFPAKEPGYMNRLLYPTGIPAICNGCMLIRKEYLKEVPAEELFSMERWLQLCVELRKNKCDMISEPEVEVRVMELEMRSIL